MEKKDFKLFETIGSFKPERLKIYIYNYKSLSKEAMLLYNNLEVLGEDEGQITVGERTEDTEIVHKIIYAEDEAGRIYADKLEDPTVREIPSEDHDVSSDPMVSEKYLDCNAVVLMGEGYAALSHYPYFPDTSITPETYLQEMIDELTQFIDKRNIYGVLMGGQREHFEENRSILNRKCIPVENGVLMGEKAEWGYKNLLVVPESEDVILEVEFKDKENYYENLIK